MRKEYRSLFLDKLKCGAVGYLIKQALKFPLIRISDLIGHPLVSPLQGILIVTYRCNLRCAMCDLWKRPQEKSYNNYRELTTDELFNLIEDYAQMGISAIGFTGGEPFLRPDIFDIITYAKQRGIITHVASNGSLLDRKMVERLFESRLDAISISVDGATAKTHDQIRGHRGSFDKVVQVIRNIIKIRKELKKKISVTVNCAISSSNLTELLDLVKFVSSLGVDGIGFIPVQASGMLFQRQERFNRLKMNDIVKIKEVLDEIKRIREETGNIDNSEEYLDLIGDFFQERALPIKCFVGYHTSVVDAYGDVFPCLPWSNEMRSIGNIRKTPIKEFWRSAKYNDVRQQIKNCRDCFWNCHTELSLIFNKKC